MNKNTQVTFLIRLCFDKWDLAESQQCDQGESLASKMAQRDKIAT